MTPLELLMFLQKCSTATVTVNPACPALAPPPGELPLDPDASSMWSTSLGVPAACCVLVAVSMALRVFTRTYIINMFFTAEDGKILLQVFLSKRHG